MKISVAQFLSTAVLTLSSVTIPQAGLADDSCGRMFCRYGCEAGHCLPQPACTWEEVSRVETQTCRYASGCGSSSETREGLYFELLLTQRNTCTGEVKSDTIAQGMQCGC